MARAASGAARHRRLFQNGKRATSPKRAPSTQTRPRLQETKPLIVPPASKGLKGARAFLTTRTGSVGHVNYRMYKPSKIPRSRKQNQVSKNLKPHENEVQTVTGKPRPRSPPLPHGGTRFLFLARGPCPSLRSSP